MSFEWDGVSDKHYAILCQDSAPESGYKYTERDNPQLGDVALVAEFDDGAVTSRDWQLIVTNYMVHDCFLFACAPRRVGLRPKS